ncbi:MAG TPA: hypothetical protein VM146_20065 [Steroidobacteraceae bacterium]|nr:hypothetical protein [Steroidobacteraceae bacterium]
MVPLTHEAHQPRELLRLWTLFLLAPCTWATSLGMLFSLVDETCVSGSRTASWVVAIGSVVLAALPGLLAWPWRRSANLATPAHERTRLMLDVAIGGSVLFTIVTLLAAVPIAFLDPCRT